MENWKVISGTENLYLISDLGRVRAIEKVNVNNGFIKNKIIPEHILKDSCNGRGYRYITISIKRVRKNYYVHRLVASAFLENKLCCEEVNHIDGDKANNKLTNLEWVSKKQNMQHAVRTGLVKSKRGDNVHAKKTINIVTGKIFACAKDAADSIQCNYGTFKDGLRRKSEYLNFKYLSPEQAKALGLSESRLSKATI